MFFFFLFSMRKSIDALKYYYLFWFKSLLINSHSCKSMRAFCFSANRSGCRETKSYSQLNQTCPLSDWAAWTLQNTIYERTRKYVWPHRYFVSFFFSYFSYTLLQTSSSSHRHYENNKETKTNETKIIIIFF